MNPTEVNVCVTRANLSVQHAARLSSVDRRNTLGVGKINERKAHEAASKDELHEFNQ